MAPPNLDTVLATVDSFAAGALDSDQLPLAIEQMRVLFAGSKACFARFGPGLGPDDAIATDSDPGFQALCYGKLAREFMDLAGLVANVPVGQVYRDDELVVRDQWRRSRIWREWMAPQDMYGGMACRVLQDEASFWLVDVQRGRHQPRFDGADIALFERMSSIIRRIGTLQRHVGRLKIQRDMTRHALDMLSVAVMIVDPSLRLVYANAIADEILAAPASALGLRGGRLAAADRADQAALKHVVEGMGQDEAISPSRTNQLMIGAAYGQKRGVSLSVMPLPRGYGLPGSPSGMLLLAKPLAAQADLAAMAQQLFGLTEAEARFAAAIASGRSLAEAAEEHGVRLSTARTHLARIFQKTGTGQQSQVAALLRCAELPLRA